MKSKQEIVTEIWKSHPDYLGSHSTELQQNNLLEFMANLFCPGPYYYYVIDSPTLTLDIVSPSTKDLLGVAAERVTIETLLDAMHPEDADFYYRCEDVVAHFLRNCISPEKITSYKISYCLRERSADGSYRLFLMQTITMKATPDGALLKVFGSHTDINHISSENNRRLSLIGLNGEPSFLDIDVFADDVFENFKPFNYQQVKALFTNREVEVIKLLSLGLSTDEIADELNIAYQTAGTHRKNLLKKSGLKNTTELVASCIRRGII